MIDFTKEGRVGDNVKSIEGGKGVILDIIPDAVYSIIVGHDDENRLYTKEGLADYSNQPTLSFANGSVTIDQGTPPEREDEELYCGLTEAQWRRVINEHFRVEVSDCQGVDWIGKSTTVLRHLTKVVPTDCYLYKTHLEQWTRARIPKEAGIRKPHFGGDCPTKHKGMVSFKMRDGMWNSKPTDKIIWVWEDSRNDITEYIELDSFIETFTGKGGRNALGRHPHDLVEIPEWDDFEIDDPVMVKTKCVDEWQLRHFAGINAEGKPTTWHNGRTSWSYGGTEVRVWDECRRPTEEEFKGGRNVETTK